MLGKIIGRLMRAVVPPCSTTLASTVLAELRLCPMHDTRSSFFVLLPGTNNIRRVFSLLIFYIAYVVTI